MHHHKYRTIATTKYLSKMSKQRTLNSSNTIFSSRKKQKETKNSLKLETDKKKSYKGCNNSFSAEKIDNIAITDVRNALRL